jgi:8-oxo-dGTP pyrophosphatase MutT (NUDIX family)
MEERQLALDVPIRPAATVMLVRDGDGGPEVFMLQRTLNAAFARGQYVFPGGRVDDADHGADFEPICDGLDDPEASARLGLESGGLAWLVASIRECFEEAGVLLARHADGDRAGEVVRFDDPDVAARFEAARHAVHDGERSLVELCVSEGLLLLTDRLHFVAHWLTPVGERRRFDTRFLVAEAPPSQEPLHDDKETIASLWVRPDDALAMLERGEIQMFPPTIACLRFLADFDTVAAIVEASAGIGVPERITPRLVFDADERISRILLPGDEGYATQPLPEYVLTGAR